MKIQKGDRGLEVQLLQESLNRLGYDAGKADGIFGDKTEKALKAYQESLGVRPDGFLGPWVNQKLKESSQGIVGKKRSIALTAGHSNTDPGAVNGKYTEAFIAVEFRNEVSKRLRSMGYTVITDGEGSHNESLSNAVKIAKQVDIAIEFHLNAAVSKAAKGVEALALEKDKLFCQELCKGISEVLDTPVRGSDKGWKSQSSGQHTRLAFCQAGGIVLESFFISNDGELKKYFSKQSELFDTLARIIAKRASQ